MLRLPAAGDPEPVHRIVASVDRIDTAAREVVIAGGLQHAERRIAYESLLIATGGHLRRLDVPGADQPELLGLRTLDDAAALAPRLRPGAHLLIVGGGFIGLEVPASAPRLGLQGPGVRGPH